MVMINKFIYFKIKLIVSKFIKIETLINLINQVINFNGNVISHLVYQLRI